MRTTRTLARAARHAAPAAAALLALLALLALPAPAAHAQTPTSVYWADWLSSAAVDGRGTVVGAMNVGGTAVGVTYTGELEFAVTAPGGTNYFTPRATFLGALLDDAQPTDGDIIALSGFVSGVNTFTFAQPVVNPVLSVVSLGRGSTPVEYVFDAPFELVSGGAAIFGGVPITSPAPNTVRGQEGNGTIRFLGTYSSLSFTTNGAEYWSGFTLGVQGTALAETPPSTVTPEPATVGLVGAGLVVMLAGARRRSRPA